MDRPVSRPDSSFRRSETGELYVNILSINKNLGGGFTFFLCSPLFKENSHFD